MCVAVVYRVCNSAGRVGGEHCFTNIVFEHLDVTWLIFRIISGVYVSLLLPSFLFSHHPV